MKQIREYSPFRKSIIFMVILILALSLMNGCNSNPSVNAFNEFVAASRHADYERAYSLLADNNKDEVTMSQFRTIVRSTFWGNKKCQIRVKQVEESRMQAMITIAVSSEPGTSNRVSNIEVGMKKTDSGGWKIDFVNADERQLKPPEPDASSKVGTATRSVFFHFLPTLTSSALSFFPPFLTGWLSFSS